MSSTDTALSTENSGTFICNSGVGVPSVCALPGIGMDDFNMIPEKETILYMAIINKQRRVKSLEIHSACW